MTLFYSAGCPVCRWLVVHLILPLDPHQLLDIIPFRSPLGRALLADYGLRDMDTIRLHWWFTDPQGRLWQANKGGAKQLLLHLTLPRWAYYLVSVVPSWVFNRLDDLINRNRPTLARYIQDVPPTMRVWGRTYNYRELEREAA